MRPGKKGAKEVRIDKRTLKQNMLVIAPVLLYFGIQFSGWGFPSWKELLPGSAQIFVLVGGASGVLATVVYYTCLFIHVYRKDDPTAKHMLAKIPVAPLLIFFFFYITYFVRPY